LAALSLLMRWVVERITDLIRVTRGDCVLALKANKAPWQYAQVERFFKQKTGFYEIEPACHHHTTEKADTDGLKFATIAQRTVSALTGVSGQQKWAGLASVRMSDLRTTAVEQNYS